MTEISLLPVGAAALQGDARLLHEVRLLSGQYGMDYADDSAVREMLHHHETVISRTGRGAPVWISGFAIVLAVLWPFIAPQLLHHPGPNDIRKFLLAYGAPALLLLVGLILAFQAHRTARRQLRHPELIGYRTVLAAARAHGVPLAHIPDWLVGRNSTSSREAAPLPAYEGPAPDDPLGPLPRETESSPATPQSPPPIPKKPWVVTEYEALADKGGWHDEVGFLLLIAGGLSALWAYSGDTPFGYFLCAVCAGSGIGVWLAGNRQGARREALRKEAAAYVEQLTAAHLPAPPSLNSPRPCAH